MGRKRRTKPPFTETDWQSSQDACALLEHVKDKVSVRKLRLIAAACGRRLSSWFRPELSLPALEVAERYADALASDDERHATQRKLGELKEGDYNLGSWVRLWQNRTEAMSGFVILYVLQGDRAIQHDGGGYIAYHGANAAYQAGYHGKGTANREAFEAGRAVAAEETAAQLHTIRDVIGNPFRPVQIDPSWLTPVVTQLANAAYEERILPSGQLDPHRLTVLADALEEAGASGDLLSHLRGPGPHVRGCFAVDGLLGKA
jgi:hypothetical protein